jgi:hypothetical protein
VTIYITARNTEIAEAEKTQLFNHVPLRTREKEILAAKERREHKKRNLRQVGQIMAALARGAAARLSSCLSCSSCQKKSFWRFFACLADFAVKSLCFFWGSAF